MEGKLSSEFSHIFTVAFDRFLQVRIVNLNDSPAGLEPPAGAGKFNLSFKKQKYFSI